MLKTHCKKKKLDYDSFGALSHEEFVGLLNLGPDLGEPESPAKAPKKARKQAPRWSLALLSPSVLSQLHVREKELSQKYAGKSGLE